MLERTDDGRIIYRGLPAVFYKMINAAQPKGETEHASNETAGAAGPVCELCNRAPVAHCEQPASRFCGGGFMNTDDVSGYSPVGSIHRAASTVEEYEVRRLALDQAVRTHGDTVDENQVVAASIEYLTFLTGGLRLCDMDGDQLRAELTRRKDGMLAAGDEMMKRAAASQGLGQMPPLVELPTMPDVLRSEQLVAAAGNAAKEVLVNAMKGVRGLYEDETVLKGTQDGVKELPTIVVQELRRFHAHFLAVIDAELASRKAL